MRRTMVIETAAGEPRTGPRFVLPRSCARGGHGGFVLGWMAVEWRL